MGTEDRVTDPKKQIAANPTVIPFVTFPGQEIKDLIVHEVEVVEVAKDPVPVPVPPQRKQAAAPPKQPVPATQPAPIVQPTTQQPQQLPPQQQQQQPPQRQQKVNSRPPPQQQQHESSSSTSEQTATPPVQSKVNPPVPPSHHTATASYGNSQQRDSRTSSSGGAGTGAHLLRLKERKERGAENTTTERSSGSGSGEFDFTAGLSMFKKDDVFAVVATEADRSSSIEVKYKKDDFFDSLSCDLTDRKEGRNTRMSAAEERVLNQDTFGAIALQSTGNYRRSFRGGGGYAGRGGGRGRGRGGRGGRSYQNQYQANN